MISKKNHFCSKVSKSYIKNTKEKFIQARINQEERALLSWYAIFLSHLFICSKRALLFSWSFCRSLSISSSFWFFLKKFFTNSSSACPRLFERVPVLTRSTTVFSKASTAIIGTSIGTTFLFWQFSLLSSFFPLTMKRWYNAVIGSEMGIARHHFSLK